MIGSVLYVNGINTSLKGAQATACKLSGLLGGRPVTYIHNDTFNVFQTIGRFFRDLVEYFTSETERKKHLLSCYVANVIYHRVVNCKHDLVEVVAHSQGADIMELALRKLSCLPCVRARVSVLTYGAKTALNPHLAGRVVNISHRTDYVAGFGGHVSKLSPDSHAGLACASGHRRMCDVASKTARSAFVVLRDMPMHCHAQLNPVGSALGCHSIDDVITHSPLFDATLRKVVRAFEGCCPCCGSVKLSCLPAEV